MSDDRRRNMRPDNCRACGKSCEAGQGYLYRDTNSRTVRRIGRFGWFVKCEECHGGNKTKMTVAMEKHAAARANEPVVRPWSVAQVRNWAVDRITHNGDVAILVETGTFGMIVSYRDPINGRFTAPTGYALEQKEFAGKPLSEKAAAELSPRILAIVVAVQGEELAAGEAAAARLVAAGATVTLHPCGWGWKVSYKGGEFHLDGLTGGANRIGGFTGLDAERRVTGVWFEGTVEELLANSQGGRHDGTAVAGV